VPEHEHEGFEPCCDRCVEDGRQLLKEMELMGLVREIRPDVFELTELGEEYGRRQVQIEQLENQLKLDYDA
jgi:hypothetical protein